MSATRLRPQAKNAPPPEVLRSSDREPVRLASAAECPLSGLAEKERVPGVGHGQERWATSLQEGRARCIDDRRWLIFLEFERFRC